MMHNINHMEYMSNSIIHNIIRRKKYMIMWIIYIIRMVKMRDRLFKTDPVILITLIKSKDMNITKLTINKQKMRLIVNRLNKYLMLFMNIHTNLNIRITNSINTMKLISTIMKQINIIINKNSVIKMTNAITNKLIIMKLMSIIPNIIPINTMTRII